MSKREIIPPRRRCTKCGNEYPETSQYFAPRYNRKSGFQSWCRICTRAAIRDHYTRNKEQLLDKNKRWVDEHPEEWRKIERRSRQKRKHLVNVVYPEKRRAQKRLLPATLTQAEWETILAQYGYACAYCGASWLNCKLVREHVVPVKQGGGYTADNIVPACVHCNSKKQGRTPEQAHMKLRDKLC